MMAYLFSGSLMGLRWQMVASSITAFEAGPSRLLTASRTVFCDLIRSCICDVRRNCRPQASRNLQEAIFAFFHFSLWTVGAMIILWKETSLLVCHGEFMSLLFVAARQLVLHTQHKIIIIWAPDRPLDDIQPPGSVQLDLEKKIL